MQPTVVSVFEKSLLSDLDRLESIRLMTDKGSVSLFDDFLTACKHCPKDI